MSIEDLLEDVVLCRAALSAFRDVLYNAQLGSFAIGTKTIKTAWTASRARDTISIVVVISS